MSERAARGARLVCPSSECNNVLAICSQPLSFLVHIETALIVRAVLSAAQQWCIVGAYCWQTDPQKQLSHSLSLQEHTKRQILIRPDTHYRGYQQLGANVTRYEDGYQRDWHEAIDLYREQSPQVMHFFPQQHPASYFTYSAHCFRQLAAP